VKNVKNVILSSFSPSGRDANKKLEELEKTKRVLLEERLAVFSSPLIRYINIFQAEYWLAPFCRAAQSLEWAIRHFWGWYGEAHLLVSKLFSAVGFRSQTKISGEVEGSYAIFSFSPIESAAYRLIGVNVWNKRNWKRKVSAQNIRSVLIDLGAFSNLVLKEESIKLLKTIFQSLKKLEKKTIVVGATKDFQKLENLGLASNERIQIENGYFNQRKFNPMLGWEPHWVNRRGPNELDIMAVEWKKKNNLKTNAEIEKERHRIYREAMSYFSQFQFLNRTINQTDRVPKPAKWSPSVSIVAVTSRPEYLEHLLKSFEVQAHSNKELVLILNDKCWKTSLVKERVKDIPNVIVDDTCLKESLGVCLNRGVELSSGEFIAKFDDDDFYGSQYLSDQLLVFTFSNADIVGKHSFFYYDSRLNFTGLKYPGMEFKKTYFLKGGTLLFRKDVATTTKFRDLGWRQSGEDTFFLRDSAKRGCQLISSDPFNFVFRRHLDLSIHTFASPDARFLSNSVYFADGLALQNILI